MLIDLTVKVTPEMATDAQGNLKKSLAGHLGTHFDIMDKEFPLEYTERDAIVFDVTEAEDREIEVEDIDISLVRKDMFVAFYTGYIEKEGYGGKNYFADHPQLSIPLIDELLNRGISLIGVDFAGIRRGKEHTPIDQYCADRQVFVIENLCNLSAVLEKSKAFTACTYPMNFSGVTGLPCRIIAKILEWV